MFSLQGPLDLSHQSNFGVSLALGAAREGRAWQGKCSATGASVQKRKSTPRHRPFHPLQSPQRRAETLERGRLKWKHVESTQICSLFGLDVWYCELGWWCDEGQWACPAPGTGTSSCIGFSRRICPRRPSLSVLREFARGVLILYGKVLHHAPSINVWYRENPHADQISKIYDPEMDRTGSVIRSSRLHRRTECVSPSPMYTTPPDPLILLPGVSVHEYSNI